MRFRVIKPEYKYLPANEEEQEELKKEIKKTLEELSEDEILVYEDECSVKQHPTLIVPHFIEKYSQ